MPRQYLPISNAMGRDIDNGKAAGRDVADFLPDHVAQELYDQSNPGPVRGENLIPISKADAHRRTMLEHDGSLPKMPATRRVIPAPFKRDVVIGGSHGKVWTTCLGREIRKDDIITDVGLVVDVREEVMHEGTVQTFAGDEHVAGWSPDDEVATGVEYVVYGAGGNILVYDATEEVKVFRRIS